MQFAIARAQWHGRVPTRRCTRCIVISLSHSIGYETIDRRRLGMCCVARNHIYIYIYIYSLNRFRLTAHIHSIHSTHVLFLCTLTRPAHTPSLVSIHILYCLSLAHLYSRSCTHLSRSTFVWNIVISL